MENHMFADNDLPKKTTYGSYLLKMVIGLALGGILFYVLFRKVSMEELLQELKMVKMHFVVLGMLSYYIALSLRTYRWKILLKPAGKLSYFQVLVALIIGYGLNIIIPARLGEVLRADFCKRMFSLSRFKVLGSIVIERMADGLVVVMILLSGLAFLQTGVANHAIIAHVALGGTILFLSVFISLLLLSIPSIQKHFNKIPFLAQYSHSFHQAIVLIRTPAFARAFSLSIIIWIFEFVALWFILLSVGILLNIFQLATVIGVVSLSTLLPSAPGFLGTMQYAYVLTTGMWGYSAAKAILAALVNQVFLLSSVVIVASFLGLLIYFSTLFRRLLQSPSIGLVSPH